MPDVPSTHWLLAKDAMVIGDGPHPLGQDGSRWVQIRQEETASPGNDTTRLALASVLGLNATLESQTNWLQRWSKQKFQREERRHQ